MDAAATQGGAHSLFTPPRVTPPFTLSFCFFLIAFSRPFKNTRGVFTSDTRQASSRERMRACDWMGPCHVARATKEKARIERFYSLSDRAADKGSKTKMVELVESKSMRMGDVIVEFDEANLQFGEKKILDGFSYAFSKARPLLSTRSCHSRSMT